MKYAWIGRHQKHWPITLQCEVLNVSTSGYFEHQRRKVATQPAKLGNRLSDEALLAHIKKLRANHLTNMPGGEQVVFVNNLEDFRKN